MTLACIKLTNQSVQSALGPMFPSVLGTEKCQETTQEIMQALSKPDFWALVVVLDLTADALPKWAGG